MTIFKKSIHFIALMLFANAFGMETTCNVTIIDANYMEVNRNVTRPAIYREDIFQYVTGMTEPDFVEQYKRTGTMPRLPANMQKLANNMSHSILTLQELRNM